MVFGRRGILATARFNPLRRRAAADAGKLNKPEEAARWSTGSERSQGVIRE